jgi:PAS domain S-box-containing protein
MDSERDGSVNPEAAESGGELAREQRDVNEQLVLSSLRAHAAVDAAKSAADEAKAKEDTLQTLADTMPILAWYANPDGSIPWYNQRWYEYTGTTVGDPEGRAWRSAHDPNDFPRILAKWEAALASGEPWEDQFRLRRRDGELRWFLSRAVPLRDVSGQIVRWFGTHVDVDDQTRAADERIRLLASEQSARQDAEAANRLKDEFLAMMSHELRTPLNAILGWSTLLRRGPRDEKSVDRALATIERNAKTQARLIEDILDVSRIISGKLRLDLQRVDMNAIARAAIDVVRPAADAKQVHLDLDVEPEEELGRLAGDADRLQQVVWNLLSNAVKFTPPGGTVALRVEQVGSAERVTVRDTGSGILPEHLPFIFERFRQADSSTTRRHAGLGLGLAIVRHLVEMHGGTVTVESGGAGLGATFTVTLPFRAVLDAHANAYVGEHADADAGSIPPPSQPATALSGIRILVVDDDEDSRILLQAVLERVGAFVHVADSAPAAIALLESHPVDVMISDIGMPHEDGYSLMQRVRALPAHRGGHVRALALTAYARGEDARRAHQAGYQTHLAKPADVDELTREVARLAIDPSPARS